MDIRESVKEELGPGVKVTEIMKSIAERWRTLTPQDKVPYVLQGNEDKKRYEVPRMPPLRARHTHPYRVRQ